MASAKDGLRNLPSKFGQNSSSSSSDIADIDIYVPRTNVKDGPEKVTLSLDQIGSVTPEILLTFGWSVGGGSRDYTGRFQRLYGYLGQT